jgi:hypothetical protein
MVLSIVSGESPLYLIVSDMIGAREDFLEFFDQSGLSRTRESRDDEDIGFWHSIISFLLSISPLLDRSSSTLV